ncbi:dip2/Utp12 family protein [Sarocladium implicatum]|nr:dip2/Utp12 family protein [Sarocladium implicatum]
MSTKRKAPGGKFAAPVVKPSAKPTTRTTINEQSTAVSAPDDVPVTETIDISSDPNSSDDDEYLTGEGSDAEEVNGAAPPPAVSQLAAKNTKRPSLQQTETAEDDGSDGEDTSPSFGELLRGSNNEVIDVPTLLQQASSASLQTTRNSRSIVAPASSSLTTVLTQALRTDDAELLESCLATDDQLVIQNTVEKLDSTLAATLLTKLAARLYRRPGRAGRLMTWVQWTLVCHGGALATQPKVLQSLAGLQKVLAERAKGLNSLLALKGKLDMLEGQMQLRRKMRKNSGAAKETDEEEDENVIFVEGEDKEASEIMTNGIGSRGGLDDDAEADITMNGLAGESDSDDDSAEEGDDSDGAEDLLDDDDVEQEEVDDSMGEDDESDLDAAPPPKKRK